MSVATEPLFDELHPPLDASRRAARGRPLPRVRRPVRAGALHGRLPGRRRRRRRSSLRSRTATRSPQRRRSSPRTCSAARARASARSRSSARAPACSRTRAGEPIAIGALQRYATDWALAARRAAPRKPRRRTGARVAVIGAGPAGLACAGELAARGYARHGLRRARGDRRPRPLRDRAVPPGRASRCRTRRRRSSALGVEFRLGTHVDASELDALAAEADAVFLGVGMGADAESRTRATTCPGVWESLPFIEALKTGTPPRVGSTRRRHRRRQHRDRRRARGAAARRRRRHARLPAHARPRCPRTRTRSTRPAHEGVGFQFLHEPGRVPRRRPRSRRSSASRCGSATPDASGRRRPEPVAGQRVHAPRRHGRQGDRPAAARRACRLDRRPRARPAARSSSTRRPAGRRTRSSSPAATPSTAARASSRPCARASARRARSTSGCDERD